MSQLTGATQIAPQELFSSSATAQAGLGQFATTGDGRNFRYAKFATLAVPGKLYQAPAEITNHQNLSLTADAAIGATEVTVTLGATLATANQYRNGYLVVNDGTGEGHQFKISGNTAAALSTACTIFLEDALPVALVSGGTTEVDLVANPYESVTLNPATATSAPVGAAVYAVAAGEYGWLQVNGPAALLADGAVVVGTNVAASNAVAGAVEAATGVQASIGTAITGIATTEYGLVNLKIN